MDGVRAFLLENRREVVADRRGATANDSRREAARSRRIAIEDPNDSRAAANGGPYVPAAHEPRTRDHDGGRHHGPSQRPSKRTGPQSRERVTVASRGTTPRTRPSSRQRPRRAGRTQEKGTLAAAGAEVEGGATLADTP